MAASRTTEQLIAQILSSPRLKESAHFSSAVYQDEPILKTAAQMDSYLPEKYREMRQIAQDLGTWTGSYGTGGASHSSGGRPSCTRRRLRCAPTKVRFIGLVLWYPERNPEYPG